LAASAEVYYWKNNPENNEKHLRKHLKVRNMNLKAKNRFQ
jgi:hypothetical protein